MAIGQWSCPTQKPRGQRPHMEVRVEIETAHRLSGPRRKSGKPGGSDFGFGRVIIGREMRGCGLLIGRTACHECYVVSMITSRLLL
jgi:hypothetical protein